MILFEWLKQNSINPYPSKKTKFELAERTSLPVSQVSTWLRNQRHKMNRTENQSNKRLTIKERIALKNYFDNVSNRPNCIEIGKLSTELNLSEAKIASWFSYHRFLYKNC